MSQLTQQQIDRQDFIDNQIFDLFNNLLPPQKQIKWNIELIGNIRDVFKQEIVDRLKIADENTFYPYIEINK